MPVSIPTDKNLGDLGHTNDHNAVYATLRDIAEKRIRVIDAIGVLVDGSGAAVVDPTDAVAVRYGTAEPYTLATGDVVLYQSTPTAIGQLWLKTELSIVLDPRQPETKDILIVSHGTPQMALRDDALVSLGGTTLIVGEGSGAAAPFTILGPQPQGAAGLSAYEIAVEQGFVGTQEEWLASLVGPTGPTGPTGPQGVTNITVDADWTPAVGVPAGTPIGTRILRRKP